MYKFIISLISLILLIGLYIYFKLERKRRINSIKTCEFYTKVPKYVIVITYIFFVLSVLLIVSTVYLFFIKEAIGYWVMLGIGYFFGLITIIFFYDIFLNIEAYSDNKIYVLRPFKKMIINISDVKYILYIGTGVYFLDKNQNKIYTSRSRTNETTLIINKIKEDHQVFDNLNEVISLHEIKNNIDEETINKYKKIGLELRYNKEQDIKDLRKVYLIIFGFIFVINTLVCLYGNIGYIIFYFIFLIMALYMYKKQINNFKKRYELDDFELGYRFFKDCKSYVGHSKYIFRGRKILSITGIVFGLLMSSMFLLIIIFDKPVIYDDLKKVEGRLEYAYVHNSSKNGYISFKLQDDEIEYRIEDFYMDVFDYSFFEVYEKGDKINIYANYKIINSKSQKTNENCQASYIYYLQSEDVEYLGYDDIIKCKTENKNLGITFTFAFFGVSLLSVVYLVVNYKICKRNMKKETIII